MGPNVKKIRNTISDTIDELAEAVDSDEAGLRAEIDSLRAERDAAIAVLKLDGLMIYLPTEIERLTTERDAAKAAADADFQVMKNWRSKCAQLEFQLMAERDAARASVASLQKRLEAVASDAGFQATQKWRAKCADRGAKLAACYRAATGAGGLFQNDPNNPAWSPCYEAIIAFREKRLEAERGWTNAKCELDETKKEVVRLQERLKAAYDKEVQLIAARPADTARELLDECRKLMGSLCSPDATLRVYADECSYWLCCDSSGMCFTAKNLAELAVMLRAAVAKHEAAKEEAVKPENWNWERAKVWLTRHARHILEWLPERNCFRCCGPCSKDDGYGSTTEAAVQAAAEAEEKQIIQKAVAKLELRDCLRAVVAKREAAKIDAAEPEAWNRERAIAWLVAHTDYHIEFQGQENQWRCWTRKLGYAPLSYHADTFEAAVQAAAEAEGQSPHGWATKEAADAARAARRAVDVAEAEEAKKGGDALPEPDATAMIAATKDYRAGKHRTIQEILDAAKKGGGA